MHARVLAFLIFASCVPAIAQNSQSTSTISEQQSALSENAKHFAAYDTNEPYWKRQRSNGGTTIDMSVALLNDYAAAPSNEHIPARAQLKQVLDDFPVVILGVAERQQSTLTPRSSFVISDWTIRVVRAYKNASPIGVSSGDQIIVARTGGTVMVNGLKIIARDANFPDFSLGHRYLLALKPLKDTNSFLAISYGSFDVTNTPVSYLDDPARNTELKDWVKTLAPDKFIELVESLERIP